MQIKQMRVDDWLMLFIKHPASVEQAKIAINRGASGKALSSSEIAAIAAFQLLQQRKAA